jgi:hypothetical protein
MAASRRFSAIQELGSKDYNGSILDVRGLTAHSVIPSGRNQQLSDVPGGILCQEKQTLKRHRRHIAVYLQSRFDRHSP